MPIDTDRTVPYRLSVRLFPKDERFLNDLERNFEPALMADMYGILLGAAEDAREAALDEYYGGVDPYTGHSRAKKPGSRSGEALQIKQTPSLGQAQTLPRVGVSRYIAVELAAVPTLDIPQIFVLENDTPGTRYRGTQRFAEWVRRNVPGKTTDLKVQEAMYGIIAFRQKVGWTGRKHMETAKLTASLEMSRGKTKLAQKSAYRYRNRYMRYENEVESMRAQQRAADSDFVVGDLL